MSNTFKTVTIMLLLGLLVGIAAAYSDEFGLTSRSDTVVRFHDGVYDCISISYMGSSADGNTTYDVYINNDNTEGITPPTFMEKEVGKTNVTVISPSHVRVYTDYSGFVLYYALGPQTTLMTYEFSVVDTSGKNPTVKTNVSVIEKTPPTPVQTFTQPTTIATTQMVTATPTPEPTENLNAKLANIEARVTVHETEIADIKLTLERTAQPTVTQEITTEVTTAALTPIPTITATVNATPTVDYDARIAALEAQLKEQEAKQVQQESIIDQILRFLALK